MKEHEYTEEELKIAHDKNGSCHSCGWHALFHEHEYERTDKINPIEFWDTCKNSEIPEEASSHRGCYIYPVKTIPQKED